MNMLEMADEERRMIVEAEQTYGIHFNHAVEAAQIYSVMAREVTVPMEAFLRFHVQAKNHLLLALFSILRRHRTQAKLNLRVCLEATVHSAYALAHKDVTEYFDVAALKPVKQDRVTKRAHNWMAKEFPASSAQIEGKKKEINGKSAHANFWSSHTNFRHEPDTGVLHLPFFDLEDQEATEVDLALCGQIALLAIDLIISVNDKCGGIALPPDTLQRWSNQRHINQQIFQDLMANPRWAAAAKLILDEELEVDQGA